jgi:hypothetical protein
MSDHEELGARPNGEGPRAAFRQRVTAFRSSLERRHGADEDRSMWARLVRGFARRMPSFRREEAEPTEEMEFAVADFDPHVMIYFCSTIAVGYGVYGWTTMRNSEQMTEVLHKFHFTAFFVEAAIAAVAALMLICRGLHTAFIAKHYQAMSAVLLYTLFALNLSQRTAAERRRALSPTLWSPHVNWTVAPGFVPIMQCTDGDAWVSAWLGQSRFTSEDSGCEARLAGATSTGVQMAYFMILSPGRLTARTALPLLVMYLAALTVAILASGTAHADPSGAARIVLFYLTLACCSLFLCRVRRDNAWAKWRASRRRASVEARHVALLDSLIPRTVFQSRLSRTDENGELVVESLDNIFVMFCSLPDQEPAQCAPDALFEVNDRVFSAFDECVKSLGLFKYHHIKESYVVVSKRAALEKRVAAYGLDEELGDFLLLYDRLCDIVADVALPAGMAPLQLRCSNSNRSIAAEV